MHHDPAEVLPAFRELVINNINADGGSALDGHAQGKIGNPDENVPGKLLGPDHGSGSGGYVCNNVTINGLQCDEENDGEQADDEENLLEIFVEPVEY